MRKLWPFILLAILSLLFLVSEMVLPKMFAQNIADIFKDYLEEGELAVLVKTKPSLNLLRGQVDKLILEGQDLLLEGLAIAEVVAVIEDIKMVRQEEEWVIEKGEMTGLKMVLEESALNDYLASAFGLGMPNISLRPDSASLSGYFTVFGQQLLLNLEGVFAVKDSRYLFFEPRRLLLDEFQIPSILLKGIFAEAGFQVDLGLFPFPFKVNQVQIGENRLTLLTKNN